MNGSISYSSSSAFVSVLSGIHCEEPPVCDDFDGDGVCDESDNCEFVPNTDQTDLDDDQIGDACDNCVDIDHDQICDNVDPCPNDPDPNCQEEPPCTDTDKDGICDDKDPCPTNDLTCLLELACPCENDWQNHGKYVVCVEEFERAHRGEPGIGDVVSIAGCSDCGGSHQGQGCED